MPLIAATSALLMASPAFAARHVLSGHVPSKVATAQTIGALDKSQTLSLAVALPLRNQTELNTLLQQIYDPLSTNYHQFLTADQFTQEFGPTQADYDKVASFLTAQGLTVTATTSNRKLIDVTGTVGNIDSAFQVELRQYKGADGSVFYAPNQDPSVDDSLAVESIVGLDNANLPVPLFHAEPVSDAQTANKKAANAGTGPGGTLAPSDARTAYNVPSNLTGSGQTLALFEFAPYATGDITTFESQFDLPNVTLDNVLLDGVSGGGTPSLEDELDIEIMIGYCPNMSKLMVYEGTTALDILNRVASDDQAHVLSISWAWSGGTSEYQSENSVYQELASEGISVFAATGDSGSWTSSSLTNPSDQPYVTGCGGTTLNTNGAGGSYASETAWSDGGGGPSPTWGIPAWQDGTANLANGSMRNDPDVAMNADTASGYSLYFQGSWYYGGGTSAAAPAWASVTALLDQQKAAVGASPLGFLNPTLYSIGHSSNYDSELHDVTSGSDGAYSAGTGWDECTGWGSPNVGALNGYLGVASIAKGVHTLTPATAVNARLDDNGSGTTNGNLVQIWQANGSDAQQWNFANIGGNTYNLAVNIGPYCLDDAGGGSGTQVEIWSCSGDLNQEWTANAVSGGYQFINGSGLCLNNFGAGTTNGNKVVSYPCAAGDEASVWKLDYTNVANGIHTLAPECAYGERLDDTNYGTTNGSPMQIWQSTSGDTAQQWNFANIGGSTYNLAVNLGPYCLDDYGGSSGTRAAIYACEGDTNQRWTFTPVSGGFEVVNGSNNCLDVSGAGTTNGTAVQSYTCNNTNAQVWAIDYY